MKSSGMDRPASTDRAPWFGLRVQPLRAPLAWDGRVRHQWTAPARHRLPAFVSVLAAATL